MLTKLSVLFLIVYPRRESNRRTRSLEHVVDEVYIVDSTISVHFHFFPQIVHILSAEDFLHLSEDFNEVVLTDIAVLFPIKNSEVANDVFLEQFGSGELMALKDADEVCQIHQSTAIFVVYVCDALDFFLSDVEPQSSQHTPESVKRDRSSPVLVEVTEDLLNFVESFVLDSQLLFNIYFLVRDIFRSLLTLLLQLVRNTQR
mmetsp:Transcript_9943/g.18108  ORF Transcript_9943/g.18108 Transcript_9943/m.18108 type:complete len:202 (-) Transcript_9943:78-683(-)